MKHTEKKGNAKFMLLKGPRGGAKWKNMRRVLRKGVKRGEARTERGEKR